MNDGWKIKLLVFGIMAEITKQGGNKKTGLKTL